MEIEVIGLKDLPTIDYKKLEGFQYDLKTLSDKSKGKLKKSLIKMGIRVPIYIWRDNGNCYCLDGHQRKTVFNELEKEKYKIPEIPYVEVTAKDKLEAKHILLLINSRYGKIDRKSNFFDDFKSEQFNMEFEIPEFQLELWKDEFEVEELPPVDIEYEVKTKSRIIIVWETSQEKAILEKALNTKIDKIIYCINELEIK